MQKLWEIRAFDKDGPWTFYVAAETLLIALNEATGYKAYIEELGITACMIPAFAVAQNDTKE